MDYDSITDILNIYAKYRPAIYQDFQIIKENVKFNNKQKKNVEFILSTIKYREAHKVLKIIEFKNVSKPDFSPIFMSLIIFIMKLWQFYNEHEGETL